MDLNFVISYHTKYFSDSQTSLSTSQQQMFTFALERAMSRSVVLACSDEVIEVLHCLNLNLFYNEKIYLCYVCNVCTVKICQNLVPKHRSNILSEIKYSVFRFERNIFSRNSKNLEIQTFRIDFHIEQYP